MTDRLTELLAQKAAAEADGGRPDIELLARIGFHKGEHPTQRGDYSPGLYLDEQTEDFQEYWNYYGKEADLMHRSESKP